METVILFLANVALPYVVMSLVCMIIVETLATALNLRGRILYDALRTLLHSQARADTFYGHPLIGPSNRKGRYPAYVPASLFVVVAAEIIRTEAREPSLRLAAAKTSGDLGRALRALFSGVPPGAELHALRDWFVTVADHTSGTYRARVTQLLFAVATVIVVSLNLDALAIAEHTINKPERDSSVQSVPIAPPSALKTRPPGLASPSDKTAGADELVSDPSSPAKPQADVSLPIGWNFDEAPPTVKIYMRVILKLAGLLASILFIVAGAPLLFDTLNRFTVVRFAIKPFDEMPLPPSDEPLPAPAASVAGPLTPDLPDGVGANGSK